MNTPLSTLSAFALLAVTVLAGCTTADAEAPTATAVSVRTAPVTVEQQALPLRANGRLATKAEIPLAFKIGGVVADVLVDEGATVRRGQPLARLHLTEIDAQVEQARSASDKAARDLARAERLYRDSVATRVQLQDAQTGAEVARAALEAARFNRRYAVIHAPADGRILKRWVETSELVGPGAPVLTLGASASGWVLRTGLADRDVVQLRLDDRAEVTFDAFPTRRFAAQVTEIADASETSGLFEVELRVDDPDRVLKSGFVATAEIYPSADARYLLVPVEALVEGDGDEGVLFTLPPGGDRARRTAVRIAGLVGDHVALSGGLTPDDYVVTDGAAYLTDSALVQVVE